MDRLSLPSALTTSLLLLSGCAPGFVAVTGQDPRAATWGGTQSETATSVSYFRGQVITVAYNGEDPSDGKIQYTATTRTVLPGATLMGWSYSEDRGRTWRHGGNVAPNDDWPVLWGDPAITASERDSRFVFMSNLAVPRRKLPSSGRISGSLVPYIGGACIARSTDGGRSFSLYQCVHADFEFYDGGSMASSKDGGIYAAFIATDSWRYDIWYARNESSPFTRLPNPFPTCRMAMHPRIRVAYPAIGLGGPDPSLFVAGQIESCTRGTLGSDGPGGYGQVVINRYHRGRWGAPRVISYPSAVNPDVVLSDRLLRTGPQFSFDVGAPSSRGDDQPAGDEVRLLYTRSDGRRLWVEGAYCDYALSRPCRPAPEWGSTPGQSSIRGDQFTPNVRAFPGFLTIPPQWAATYVSRDADPGGNTVSVRHGKLVMFPNGSRVLLTTHLTGPMLVCPDNRGYWGDYDDLQFIGFPPDGTDPQFIRTFTSSAAGCTRRWEHTSEHVHIGSAILR